MNEYKTCTLREPDEAYIIKKTTGKNTLVILEKKYQNCAGSVDLKLWASLGLKIEYEKTVGDIFDVHYCFCLSEYLNKKMNSNDKKYIILKEILKENDINVFYGDENEYFTEFNNYIKSLE